MISALTINHDRVIKEKGSDIRWMVLSTFSAPSVELVDIETGEVRSFGDGGITAHSFTETDEILMDTERNTAFKKMSHRRKHGFYDGGKASVHKLKIAPDDVDRLLSNKPGAVGCFLSSPPGLLSRPGDEKFIDLISQEINRLKKASDAGRLRGIAISCVLIDDESNISGTHNFITDGRGVSTLNAGIDLVKDYIVETLRENFGVKKNE